MKKVILFGLNKFQNKIENILSDKYKIIGYSDDKHDFKTYEYKPFYSIDELNNIKFDYLIICNPNKQECEATLISLRQKGIEERKIIQPYCLAWNERMFRTTFDDFIDMKKQFEGLVFGMSYSRFAFLTHYFDKEFFKFSLGGVDIYTNLKWISYLLKREKKLLSKVQYIVLDLPYYIFNWDITSTSQIFYRMAYFDRFNDYRDFSKNTSGQKYINNYKVLKDMFAKNFEANISCYSNNYLENGQLLKKANDEDYFKASKIWYKRHEKTIEENKILFQEFINKLYEINPNVKISIVTYPYCQKFMETNKEHIENMRKEFYSIINSTKGLENVKHFDFLQETKYIFDDTCFRDATHFNGKGAELFSKILNKKYKEIYY